MTIVKNILGVAAVGAAFAFAGQAIAAPVHIDLRHATSSVGSGYGNAQLYSLMDDSGRTVNVRATAFAYQGADWDSGTHATARLGSYSGGLGVTNRGEDGSSPGHTLDNGGRSDYIVLQFDRLVRPESVGITTFAMGGDVDGDTNIFLGYVPTGFDTYIDPTSDFATLSSFLDFDTDYWAGATDGGSHTSYFDFGSSYGNVVVVSADQFRRSTSPTDAFKLKFINLDVFSGGGGTPVPAPGILGLMGLGLAGLGALRQRKRAAA